MRGGSPDALEVIWDRSPDPAFAALETGDELPHRTPTACTACGWPARCITQIATAVNCDGRIEVAAIGTDTALNHIWQLHPGG